MPTDRITQTLGSCPSCKSLDRWEFLKYDPEEQAYVYFCDCGMSEVQVKIQVT